MEGKNCLVTGSSRGLGKATVRELMGLGCYVFMAQRGKEEEKEVAKVREEAGGRGGGRVVSLDLGDLDSVEGCVGEVKRELEEKGELLDVVILNAAIVPAVTALTKQG